MGEQKASILVVEDDVDVAEMLDAYFRGHGYITRMVNEGGDAISVCRSNRPDLVILDIRLPDIDGYEVARRLRASTRTKDIPILFLTDKRQRNDKLQGLSLGADDYVTKPFDIHELRLRVRNILRRTYESTITNPVTGLSEEQIVDERLRECLSEGDWAVLLIELENLDAFRETYGIVVSDDVLRAIGLMIHNAVRQVGSPSDFIGHVGPASYLLVTTPKNLPKLTKRVESRLKQSLDYFYPLSDRASSTRGEKGLAIRINHLLPSQGPFRDVEHMKEELARRAV